MSILEDYKADFNVLECAAKNGDLALLECTDAATGKTVMTVCLHIYHKDVEDYIFVPLAKLFDGNPFEELIPPSEHVTRKFDA